MTTPWITEPLFATGATEPVNRVSVPAVGGVVGPVKVTVGCGFGLTLTELELLTTFPKLSVTVPTIV